MLLSLCPTDNDKSVLESHHAAVTCEVLRQAGCDVLSGLDSAQRKEVRGVIIESILHTDMVYHAGVVSTLQLRVRHDETIQFECEHNQY